VSKDPRLATRAAEYRAIYANGIPASVRRVLIVVELETGVTVTELRRGGRARRCETQARQLAIVRLHAQTKLGYQAIAAILNRNHYQSVWRTAQKARRPIC